MPDTYTNQLFVGTVPASSSVSVGPVAPGFTWILRYLTCYQGPGAGHFLAVRLAAGGYTLIYLDFNTVGPWQDWDGRLALSSGQTLSLASGPGACNVSLTGYVLGVSPG